MKKGDVGMAKHFSKKYGNKGWAFDYPVSAIWNHFLFCQDACQCLMLHPYITASRNIINIVLLPARASEQGDVIGSVRIYMYKKICNWAN